jgi:hypothetical protein
MFEFKVQIQIQFIKTFNLSDFKSFYGNDEPVPEEELEPTQKEIDEFMISKTRYGSIRYKEYIKTIFNYTTCVQIHNDDIKYLNNGIIEFIVPETECENDYEPSFTSHKEIKEYLLSDSLEDGLFESQSISSFPFRASLLNNRPIEMGLLDYRKNDIIITKI